MKDFIDRQPKAMSGATLLILVLIGLVAGFLGGMIGLGGARYHYRHHAAADRIVCCI